MYTYTCFSYWFYFKITPQKFKYWGSFTVYLTIQVVYIMLFSNLPYFAQLPNNLWLFMVDEQNKTKFLKSGRHYNENMLLINHRCQSIFLRLLLILGPEQKSDILKKFLLRIKKKIGKNPINYVLKISLSSPSRSHGHYLSLFSLQSKCYKICIKTDRLTLLFAKEI